MSRQGIEQGRAKAAYDFAKKAKEKWRKPETPDNQDTKEAKEYKSYVKKIPMMIKTNGLGAAVAFVKAKRKLDKPNAYTLIYEQLTDWLSKKSLVTSGLFGETTNNFDLIQKVIEMDSQTYRTVTIETLALLAWVSRFAEGLIQGEAEEND